MPTRACVAAEQRKASPARTSGDHSAVAPPVPIPNTAVKRCSPDGSAAIGRARVGRRQNPAPKAFGAGLFLYRDSPVPVAWDEDKSTLNFLPTWTLYFQAVSQNFAQRTFIERGDVQQIGATSQRNCLKWKRNNNFRGTQSIGRHNQRRSQLFGHAFEPRGGVH
jgi:hypothetical protein